MKLLEQIISSVTETKEPVSDTLRRCLVLAYKLKNDRLKEWAEAELNGYEDGDSVPDYRRSSGVAKGLFLGGWGSELRDQPLPSGVLEPQHRRWANEINLTQPIAAYEDGDKQNNAMIPWPQDLVVYYQSKFYQGMALNRAWTEVPASLMIGLVDTVKTRVLTFALEIQGQLPSDTEEALQDLPKDKVDQAVQVHIYGGQPMINLAGTIEGNVTMVGNLTVMKQELKDVGVPEDDLAELETVLEEDAKELKPGEKPTPAARSSPRSA